MKIEVGPKKNIDPNHIYAHDLAKKITTLHQTYADLHIHETCNELDLKCNIPNTIINFKKPII